MSDKIVLLVEREHLLKENTALRAERDAAVRERDAMAEKVGNLKAADAIGREMQRRTSDELARTQAVVQELSALRMGDIGVAMVALSVCAQVQREQQGGDGADACDRVASALGRAIRALAAPTMENG